VLSTHQIEKLNYQIFNHGGAIDSKIFSVPNSKKFEVKIASQSSMAPNSEIIFYYLTSDGEIISDKISAKFEKTLPNDVRITCETVDPIILFL
jgi:hypothetical protein